MQITENIAYVGVNDHEVDLFEGRYAVPDGMAYNSYVILDEKIAVFDSVDAHFGEEWMAKLESLLTGRRPDYLIVQHMEPDHSANIERFATAYPEVQIVASKQAFVMMKQFFGTDFADRQMIVGEGDTLSLGTHNLRFIAAPMVHWPEVIMTYEETEKVLFSADAFGKFGALDVEQEWEEEARRYYIGIVGKYGMQVQALLKKVSGLDVHMICSLHGPVLREKLGKYIALYDTWSSYRPEKEGVLIAYASAYGHTAQAAWELADLMREYGICCETADLARDDMDKAVADAFKYDRLVLAAPTYNAGVYPFMKTYINLLLEHNFQSRRVAFIENGSWAPMAAKTMTKLLEGCKDVEILETIVTVKGALNDESRATLKSLAKSLAQGK